MIPGVARPDQVPTVTKGSSTAPSITSGTLLGAGEMVIGILNSSLQDAPLPTLANGNAPQQPALQPGNSPTQRLVFMDIIPLDDLLS